MQVSGSRSIYRATPQAHDVRFFDTVTKQMHYWNLDRMHEDIPFPRHRKLVPMAGISKADVYGVPIYEADVVTIEGADNLALFQIVWAEGEFTFLQSVAGDKPDVPRLRHLPLIVLGNIFENPELRLFTLDAIMLFKDSDPSRYSELLRQLKDVRAKWIQKAKARIK
ncbi:MAG TPA: YopX family protein [Acidobacteriota bacterium]|nr:YopX family protein [Acidobacteriota bacterium]HNG91389.1 YopX family protein [Acidobacteriota bacterium]